MSNASLLSIIPFLLGGVGLFLVGMILMADGLKSAAGSALKHILERFTSTPLTAFFSGVGLTALVQSSSATTITTIGFVSAGLLSFSAAIGVIVGANVGTTSTGWIVSLLGFRFNVGAIALPFIGVGALMRLLGDGRRAHLGMVIAGFGLIFVGIDFLQEGMGGLANRIDLSNFSDDTIVGSLILMLVGMVMTVLLQSSSAAVALTLTALYSNAIQMEQAAILVIGQNLGTTVKAALAAIGASVPARRTAVAHILFNLLTALMAFAAVKNLLTLVDLIGQALGWTEPALEIAMFHTVFNLMGALIFLPITRPFARLVSWLVPDKGPVLTRHLDKSLLGIPNVAVEATARAIYEIAAVAFEEAVSLLRDNALSRAGRERLWATQTAMKETNIFLGNIQITSSDNEVYNRRLSLLHVGDHLDRLIEALLEFQEPVHGGEASQAAASLAAELRETVAFLRRKEGDAEDLVRHLGEESTRQADTRRTHRVRVLEKTAAGEIPPKDAHRQLDSTRWVDRLAYHTWRAMYHLLSTTSISQDRESEVYVEAEEEYPNPVIEELG